MDLVFGVEQRWIAVRAPEAGVVVIVGSRPVPRHKSRPAQRIGQCRHYPRRPAVRQHSRVRPGRQRAWSQNAPRGAAPEQSWPGTYTDLAGEVRDSVPFGPDSAKCAQSVRHPRTRRGNQTVRANSKNHQALGNIECARSHRPPTLAGSCCIALPFAARPARGHVRCVSRQNPPSCYGTQRGIRRRGVERSLATLFHKVQLRGITRVRSLWFGQGESETLARRIHATSRDRASPP